MYRSQQYLPFTVLKPAEYGRYFTSPIGESQQYLPFTVLKRDSNCFSSLACFHAVATVLTVYGIETH